MPLWMRRMFHTSPTGLRRSKDHCSAFDVLISKSNFWEEMYELRYSFTFFVFSHKHHAFLVQPCDLWFMILRVSDDGAVFSEGAQAKR